MTERVDFADLSWMQVEERLRHDIRVVLPLGATEEHGHLSLATDSLFIDRVTQAACAQAGVLRAPVLPFGCSAFAACFPGSLSVRTETLCRLVGDLIDCLYRQGFRRLIFVTGHGGNEVVTGVLSEAQLDRSQLVAYYRDGWRGMQATVERVNRERGWPAAEHGSWYEAFPFVRVGQIPDGQKVFPLDADFPSFPLNPRTARRHLADGVHSGRFDASDPELMNRLLAEAIEDLARFLRQIPPGPPEL